MAERAELPKSTVARLLAALEYEGAVEQVASGGEYRLGNTLADLAGVAAPGYNLVTAARPHLMELTNVIGESSGLSILDDGAVYYLDHVEAVEEVMVRSWTGERIPFHLVPSGLALLAGEPSERVDRHLRQNLEKATERSVITPEAIRARVADVQRQGYLWFHQEFDDSICSVASPVWDDDGSVMAAIHVHGPAYRFPGDSDEREIGKLVQATAERLATQLHG